MMRLLLHVGSAVLLVCILDIVYGCTFQPDGSSFQCEPMNYPQYCPLGNSNTFLPNIFNHTLQDRAAQFFVLHSYLLSLNCSIYAEHFLCFSVFPLCIPNQFRRVEPCRELCLAVRESCLPFLNVYNLQWPREFECNRFKPFGSALCIWKDNTPCTTTSTLAISEATLTTTTGARSPPYDHRDTNNCSGHLAFYPNNSRTDFSGIRHCAESCNGVYFDHNQQNFALIWITAWSLLCLLISVVTFLTYILNFRKIPSLEAPIYYIALCYAIVALTYTVSIAVGRNALMCHHEFTNEFNNSLLEAEGLKNPLCAAIFSLLYYFSLCSWTWWGVLTCEWLLCSLKCTYINDKWKVCFHIIAWGVPVLFLLPAVTLGHVTGDPILRTCWIRKHQELPFLIIPLSVIVLLCSVVVLICFGRVVSIQKDGKDENVERTNAIKSITLIRVGVFCTVFLIPMGLLLCCYWYEFWYRNEWEEWYLQCNGACSEGEGPKFEVFMAKFAASLLMGILTVGWVFRGSSILAWKKVFCLWQTKKMDKSYSPNAVKLQFQNDQYSSQFTFTETSV